MITKFSTCLLFLALLLNSCQQRNQPTSPQYEAEYNRSTTPALIDIKNVAIRNSDRLCYRVTSVSNIIIFQQTIWI